MLPVALLLQSYRQYAEELVVLRLLLQDVVEVVVVEVAVPVT
jgi:hypothetical protein